MLSYADSSFLVRLLTHEAGSDVLSAAYRRRKCPPMAFGPLHDLEVRNALRWKVWIERQQAGAAQLQRVVAQRATWESRLDVYFRRGRFSRCAWEWADVVACALELSEKHTATLGTRSFDVLHVAAALTLHCKDFLTCDEKQSKLAKAAGLSVTLVRLED